MFDINKIIEVSELQKIVTQQTVKRRFIFTELAALGGKHLVGLVGHRGVGKTVLLKQLAVEKKDSVYFSADTITDMDLFEVVEKLVRQYGFKNIFIDEIHFARDYSSALKSIYDLLPGIRVYFSSSVAISLRSLPADLSRRLILYTVNPFSFREYLFFKFDRILPTLTWDEFLNNKIPPEILQVGAFFENYLTGGLMPFALDEPKPLEILKNILEAILTKDIAKSADLSGSEIDSMAKMVRFIAKSPGVDGINYSSLSQNVGITKYKAQQYADLLERAFVLFQIRPYGTSVTREPKVLMIPPYRLLETEYSNAIGGLREDFFALAMGCIAKGDAHPIAYLKSMRGTKTPDFVIADGDQSVVFEIGGRSKGMDQFKDFGSAEKKIVLVQDLDITRSKKSEFRIPLHAMGFIEGDEN